MHNIENHPNKFKKLWGKYMQAPDGDQGHRENSPIANDDVLEHQVPLATEDPLLESLLFVAESEGLHASRASLLAALPLVDGKLTPELYLKSAEKVGLHASVVQRNLAEISPLVLPAVLLLKKNNAAVLLSIDNERQEVELYYPLLRGRKVISICALEQDYTGYALYTVRKPKFDNRVSSKVHEDKKHWFWGTLAKSWRIYRDVLIASFLINIFVLANPLFVMNVYDRVVPNSAIETLWALAIGIIVLYLFDFTLKILRSYFIEVAGKKSDIQLSSLVLQRILGAKYSEHPQSVGAFVSHLREFETVRNFITSSTITAFVDLPFVVLFLLVIVYIGGAVVWVPIALIPLIILYSWYAQVRLRNYVANTFSASAQKNATLVETLTNLDAVKTLNAEGVFLRKWDVAIGQLAKWGLKSRVVSNSASTFAGLVQQLGAVFVVVVGVYLIAERELTQGALIACVILSGRVLAPLAQVSGLLVQYYQSKLALDSLNELVNKPQEHSDDAQFIQHPKLTGDIEFKSVDFVYPGEESPSLNQVSMHIRAGEKVAFIGRIGSGKSTLQKLLLALYQPKAGNVLLDGVDISQYDPVDIRNQVGYVAQDSQLFFGTIRENIMYGQIGLNDDELLRVSELSGVASWINSHPLAYERNVGERGEHLSGGQRQSINLARGMVNDPEIMILDEPTSAMDNASEAQFIRKFKAHAANKTLLISTHKVALLELVNRVIVMDKGKVVADGDKESVLNALKRGQLNVSS